MLLSDIIGAIESNNNRKAFRFEPETFARISNDPAAIQKVARIKQWNRCSDGTAEMIYSTSWGAYQIMGLTLYDLGYAGAVLDFIDFQAAQVDMFNRFVARNGINFSVDQLTGDTPSALHLRQQFAIRYNGPGAVDLYAARIADEIARQSIKT